MPRAETLQRLIDAARALVDSKRGKPLIPGTEVRIAADLMAELRAALREIDEDKPEEDVAQ